MVQRDTEGNRGMVWGRWRRWSAGCALGVGTCLALSLVLPSAAIAEEEDPSGTPGDGYTPTYGQLLDQLGPQLQQSAHQASASDRGDASYGFELDLPPALLSPSVAFQYSSGSSYGSEMSHGWTLSSPLELRQAQERAFGEDEYHLSGDGLSGMLLPDSGWSHLLYTTADTHVEADWQSPTNEWVVSTGDVTWLLQPMDVEEGTQGTVSWRAVSKVDRLGNRVDYSYTVDGRLDTIQYGGNESTGDHHLVQLIFRYDQTARLHTDVSGGWPDQHGHLLTGVEVQVWGKKSSSWQATRGYALSYTLSEVESGLVLDSLEGVELLDSIAQVNADGSVSETLVSFEYTHFDMLDGTEDDRLVTLGSTTANMDSGGEINNESCVFDAIVDMNGDGLPDQVHADGTGNWQVVLNTYQGWAEEFHDASGPAHCVTETFTQVLYDSANLLHTRANLEDMDGDGFPDLIVADNTTDWLVYYGTGTGFLADPFTEEAPTGFLGTRYLADASFVNDKDAVSRLVDINGDGWLDWLWMSGGQFKINYHSGIRGGGFDLDAEEGLAPTGPNAGDAPATAIEMVERSYVGDALQSTKQLTGLYDLNGDGFVDFVDVRAWEASTNEVWRVYWGNRQSFEETPVDWPAPTGDLELFSDGSPAIVESYGETPDSSCPVDCEWLSGVRPELNEMDDGIDEPEWEDIADTGVFDDFGEDPADGAEGDAGVGGGFSGTGYTTGFCVCMAGAGTPSAVHQTLMDVDGDNQIDLVVTEAGGEGKWYRNLGDGFSTDGGDLPSWWPAALTSSRTTVVQGGSYAFSTTEVVSMTRDFDGNGIADAADFDAGNKSTVYSDSDRPFRLNKVIHKNQGETNISYRPSTTVHPAGNWEASFLPSPKMLVDSIWSYDPLTGRTSTQEFQYYDALRDEQVFLGFGATSTIRSVDEVRMGATTSFFYSDMGGSRDPIFGALPGRTYTVRSVALDGTTQQYKTDAFYEYGDFGSHRLKTRVELQEVGEDAFTEAYTIVDYDWDERGNLVEYAHDGGGDVEDAIAIQFDYAFSEVAPIVPEFNVALPTISRIARRTVWGIDPLHGSLYGVFESKEWREFAVSEYLYDDNSLFDDTLGDGLLTEERIHAGWVGGGEALDDEILSWTHVRDARGTLRSSTDTLTGQTTRYGYGFGDAVRTLEFNHLGHITRWGLDSEGRVTSVTDPNGMIAYTGYDPFGRITQHSTTDVGGTNAVTAEYSYETNCDAVGEVCSVQTDTYTLAGLESTSFEVFDGFGRRVQIWTQNQNADYLVSNVFQDLAGNTVQTTHPQMAATFKDSIALDKLGGGAVFKQALYDGFGNARLTHPDVANGIGEAGALLVMDTPRERIEVDEEEYAKYLTYDAHGRLIQVEEGRYDDGEREIYEPPASYRYDPQHRMVQFVDPGGTTYQYDYDGAGRLREVHRGTDPSTTEPWVHNEYDGMRKVAQYDADALSALHQPASVEWVYDDIGRPIEMRVADPLEADGYADYTWTYDGSWIGAVEESSDPSGVTRFDYNQRGQLVGAERDYDSLADTTEFTYEKDLLDRVVRTTFPSGQRVEQTYGYGVLTETVVPGGVRDLEIQHTHNKWGKLTASVANLGHSLSIDWTTPLFPDAARFDAGSQVLEREYTFLDNGLLGSRTAPGSFEESYTYDERRQLVEVSDALAGAVESYSYDAAGNVVEMTEMNGTTWFYELHTGMNQVPGRTNGSTDEVYEYDDSGRVVSVTSDSKDEVGYQYDGLGRLRALTDASGAVTRSFDRDAAGDIVRRGQADNALVMSYSYAFKQWNYNEYSGEVEENLTSMISLVNGDRRWHFKDFDGQAVATVDDDGTMVGRRRLSAYGQVQSEQGDPSVVASFHGIREEKGLDLLAAGPRHLARTDGRWLQPEPLLHMGIPQESLSDPLSLSTYRYSRNTPTVYQDRSGYSPVETLDEYLAETYLMPADGRISSAYNPNRFHPIEKKPKPHNGTDIDAPTGTPVRAPMDGSIQRVVPLNKDAGNTIQMLDTKGVEWKFFHLDSFNVEVGDVVKRGDVIGAVGNTGASTGPHLHAETRVDGEHFDMMTLNPKNDPLQLLTPEEQEEMDAIIREAGDLEPKQDGEIPSYSEE